MSTINLDDIYVNQNVNLPRYTTTQRNGLSPVVGTLIYNTTENYAEAWDGTRWRGFGKAFEPVNFSITAQSYGQNAGTFSVVDEYVNVGATANFGFSGYYKITIPSDSEYQIEAIGTNGGRNGLQNASPLNLAARIVVRTTLAAGTELICVAGQTTNQTTSDAAGTGGGGGTFIAIGSTVATAQPLVVAGGGGGSCYLRTAHDTSRTYANTGRRGRAGVSSGYDPEGHGWPEGFGGRASSGERNIAAWNGGGFFGDGVNGTTVRLGGSNGKGFVNGLQGGLNQGGVGTGGFGGGGGGANNCGYGGGGGGYSGGGSGGYNNGCGGDGGGGGSYYDTASGTTLITAQNIDNNFGFLRIVSVDLL